MTGYSTEYKEMIVKRMLAEDAVSVRELVAETGVSRSTLYKWRSILFIQGLPALIGLILLLLQPASYV